MTREDLNHLIKSWKHSFEEDLPNEMVFRPLDYVFPRARGRQQLDFSEDGKAQQLDIGRDDVPAAMKGSWAVHGDKLTILFDDSHVQLFDIRQVKEDKLVLHAIDYL